MKKPFICKTIPIMPYLTVVIGVALSATALANNSKTPDSDKTPNITSNHTTVPQTENNRDIELSDMVADIINPETVTPTSEEWGWMDEGRKDTKQRLNKWANTMNGWFGETDPKAPAEASLRIIIDTRWVDDPIDGSDVSVEPRIRGRLKLPVLENRLSVVIGDDELDNEAGLKQDSTGRAYYQDTTSQNKTIDRKKAREDNGSIALRWSRIKEGLGIDADIGVRSGDDVYFKLGLDRELYENGKIKVSNDTFYRYGSQSEHYARTGTDVRFGSHDNRFINNRVTLHYGNEDDDEQVYWRNDLRQFHYFDNNKQLSYGLFASGDLKGDNDTLNSYGPTISYRQPIWRNWLYAQTELNYYNDKAEDKDHYPAMLVRLEALF